MTLLLTDEEVSAVATIEMAIEAMEGAYRLAGDGRVGEPRRYDIELGSGWLRLMAVDAAGLGVFGYKAMNLMPGVGVRYGVYVYDCTTGALLAVADARRITALRTAACSAVAARRLVAPGVRRLAVIGTGAEARTQLLAMQAVRPAGSVAVYSRSAQNRQRFADEMAPLITGVVEPCNSVAEATKGASLIVLATKSETPVLEVNHLDSPVHVNSVGAARLNQRELAPEVFSMADLIVCDSVELVTREAGDAAVARDQGHFDPSAAISLAELLRDDQRRAPGITVFKSVGSALQDLALAVRVVDAARSRGLGTQIDNFPSVK